jgi:hypothetical protein
MMGISSKVWMAVGWIILIVVLFELRGADAETAPKIRRRSR